MPRPLPLAPPHPSPWLPGPSTEVSIWVTVTHQTPTPTPEFLSVEVTIESPTLKLLSLKQYLQKAGGGFWLRPAGCHTLECEQLQPRPMITHPEVPLD